MGPVYNDVACTIDGSSAVTNVVLFMHTVLRTGTVLLSGAVVCYTLYVHVGTLLLVRPSVYVTYIWLHVSITQSKA